MTTTSSLPPRSNGGGKEWTYDELEPYTTDYELPAAPRFLFRAYVRCANLDTQLEINPDCIPCDLPLRMLADKLVVAELKELCREHRIDFSSFDPRQGLVEKIQDHECSPRCAPHVTLVSPVEAREKGADKALGRIFQASDLQCYLPEGTVSKSASYDLCGFFRDGETLEHEPLLLVAYPIKGLITKLTRPGMDSLCSVHGIHVTRKMNKKQVSTLLTLHTCNAACDSVKAGFRIRETAKRVKKKLVPDVVPFLWEEYTDKAAMEFPPDPINLKDVARCVHDYCQQLKPEIIEQLPCAVCAQLTSRSCMREFEKGNYNLDILEDPSSTRKTRHRVTDPVEPLHGPVLMESATHVCEQCHSLLTANKKPKYSLANGLWVGEVPEALQDLTLAEQALISRIRRNRSLIRVSAGHFKMIANVIALPMPTVKVYNKLPPPKGEIDDVIAVVFTGIKPPEEDELRRTPALVRRAKVLKALEWLKLNHCNYSDLEIDQQALDTYDEEGIPVGIVYRETRPGQGNVLSTARAVNDDENERGTEHGPCPLTVHGLSPTKFSTMDVEERRFAALLHLRNGGGALAAGHAEKPASFFDNPLLYPLMFPWLFPYGIGSVGQERHFRILAEDQHKRWLLNYHDKRFQRDGQFIITAFNHEQMKDSSGASFVMVKRGNFANVAQKLKEINPEVLNSIATRMRNGERVTPVTEHEKRCFRLMDHIDYVGGHVDGSLAKRKYMRNQLWSLVSFQGAPSWFVTFAPADNRHPLCIFWADEGLEYRPEIVLTADRDKVITNNPVACAKFFHFLVQLFLEHILGWGKEHRGVFGNPSAYFGTVEQQGRMTLHLHILIWIVGALSPREIREKLTKGDKEFERKLTAYLESVQIGQFLTGSKEEVASRIPLKSLPKRRGIHQIMKEYHRDEEDEIKDYKDPTLHLPESPPPVLCQEDPHTCGCSNCKDILVWYRKFEETVDDLMWRVNVHVCDPKTGPGKGGGEKSCGGSEGKCYARFPRPVFPKTVVDEKDGHIDIKKLESSLNNITPAVTYTNICNTDTTSLQSGTGIKAIVGYVCDYLTKTFLKTHQIFSTMYDVFNRNSDLWKAEDEKTSDAARKMIMKVVNSLSAKMELGAPMAALYLLGNPDHYTSHQFVSFYWKNYVNQVVSAWDKLLSSCESSGIKSEEDEYENMIVDDDGDDNQDENDYDDDGRVVLQRSSNFFVSRSSVDDYSLRPSEHENICLYEWIQCSVRDSNRFANPTLLYYKYQPEHSMADSHLVACDPDRRRYVVPNFIGPPLPRISNDGKECEDYYCAMLTFFKPWRSGLELRGSDQTWKEAFEGHSFSERQRQIMRNFNVRFECYDARDDFHAQRRAKEAEEGLGPDVEMEGHGNETEEFQTTNEGHAFDESYWMAKTVRGRWADTQEEHATRAYEALGGAGWKQGSRGGCTDESASLLPALEVQSHMNAAYWNDIVKREKTRVWKDRFSTVMGGRDGEDMDLDIKRVKVRDDAYIVYEAFFRKSFTPAVQRWVYSLDEIEAGFTLNKEQSRAFRIIANHATCIAPDQLLMYLGGMAGSGKTQVLRALIAYFKVREEPYRLILLGPTGTSSALIGGTTYHSFLSLVSSNWGTSSVKSELKAVEEVRERLMGVNYIFIDEVSMLSCHDVCRISERLCDAMNVHEKPFGGLNMIFAGDFAQLPPTKGHALYSGEVSLRQSPRQKVEQQEETIGKSIWLQFTTVVMLKANMRQTSQSDDDVRFRRALENLRYKACTEDDINFLKSRIAGSVNGLSLDEEPWRYVSIITSRNVQKDIYNEQNVKRFAAEHGRIYTPNTAWTLSPRHTQTT
ncbi:hypothetical protein CC1G_04819 [Coprinopsis cinerea okayama7|uniref:ATP-dependent DNA helicase n=1 Tax=Coprinopsis cinerea (strain Okayama-7 / 130 / ATCC MYA-4618 / FGSC 9003) TaxID=240176 RepID=A8P2P2_COPC7|nr:hypothetical protein CC1G_04819 [Coprinopsis cinerea okayama7\|eukprot:XP_001838375.2 hypothetical protein CC1G_04819 [Coprinopsis cinerea okayama7\